MIPSADLIRDLALRRPGAPVLSVYVRTDPRDPANTAAVPGWLMELRNCLREVSREVEQNNRPSADSLDRLISGDNRIVADP